ncbi:MAG: hypothetical protein BIP78_0015 [Candidatus Bipolaricaulis sibiricus]|uniref:Uncharacterized protein n=1 Tax=Bipolaricaulis sibiricus TaxID=2501609 RepID=A0A410FRX6_BIPS1|nr:MAG: hypothetical protein BIP78_0015 [Candidatus Bipolaricaulis sibiricus]
MNTGAGLLFVASTPTLTHPFLPQGREDHGEEGGQIASQG